MAAYEPLAKTTKITATSRASMKIRDSYYTLEYSEERVIPDVEGVDLEAEKKALWDEVNTQVDVQMQETYDAIRNK